MNKIDRIQELVKILNEASDAYYNSGNTIMNDAVFDILMKELKTLEFESGIILSNSPTRNVGTEVKDKINKTTHDNKNPMLSLDKCHFVQELIDFADDDNCYLSVKCDGLSTRLIYKNHKLVGAATRGDGQIGTDVLFHAKRYVNIPLEIPYDDDLVIDGESVILENDFLAINERLSESERFANCRNLAAGTLSNLDANITKSRNMRFIAWRVIEGFQGDSNFFKLKEAEQNGFTIVPMWTYSNEADAEALPDMLNNLKEQASKMGLPLDGAVMAKDSIALSNSMGRTDKFFRHSIAYKYEDEVYETKLIDVEWTLGRTGQLTPTAVFEPVWIEGSEVSRASVHNISIMQNLKLTKGCTVGAFKANCIIPQISYARQDGNEEISIPTICPVCGGATSIQKENASEVLVCINPNCSGKLLGKLNHFVSRKCMNIDGLSEATLEKFISLGYISNFKDIYHVSDYYDQLIKLEGFGAKSIQKLLQAIEKSRDVKLENFIAALGIPNIGLSAAKTISQWCNGDYERFAGLQSSSYMGHFSWTLLDDFGKVMAKSMYDYLESNFFEMDNLAQEMHFVKQECKEVVDNPFSGKTLCVTGKLNHFSRDSINAKIADLGAKAASSVSKKTDYLITNEQSGSSKYKKAVELNIPIITENEFLNMIGE